jgi:kumamolisin
VQARSNIRLPRAAGVSYTPQQVAARYAFPANVTGAGYTVGIIELGGGYRQAELDTYLPGLGSRVTAVPVAGGSNSPGDDADGEVLLDIEVVGAIATGAKINVYFAPNTDDGFLAAFERSTADKCVATSDSWGQAETEWDRTFIDRFNAAFLDARQKGTVVLAASGDTGANDSTGSPTVDFPASSPHVVGCGGTSLPPDGPETEWNGNPTSSSTGGGISVANKGRRVPDIAGNADPQTGWRVLVNGARAVYGGTSAVAPMYAAWIALMSELIGAPIGTKIDMLNWFATNPDRFYDVTIGDARVGVGRDLGTGWGRVLGDKFVEAALDNIPDPLPLGQTSPSPAPTPAGDSFTVTDAVAQHIGKVAVRRHETSDAWLDAHLRSYFNLPAAGSG